jgi:hypothetical protein
MRLNGLRFHDDERALGFCSGFVTAVDLGDRTIAEVNYLSDFGDRIWKAPNLVQNVSPLLTDEEAMWIIPVIAMGLLYGHCRTSRMT